LKHIALKAKENVYKELKISLDKIKQDIYTLKYILQIQNLQK